MNGLTSMLSGATSVGDLRRDGRRVDGDATCRSHATATATGDWRQHWPRDKCLSPVKRDVV